jgi:peptidyl-prolyl cis-trans isomerase C
MNMKFSKMGVCAAVAVLVTGSAGAAYSITSRDQAASPSPATVAGLAIVNGRVVTESSLLPMLQNGLDRTNALDRRITLEVVSQTAEKAYAAEAKAALDAARGDILFQLYAAKRTAAIRSSITERDIAEVYETKISAEDARQLKVRVYVTSDAREAQAAFEAVSARRSSPEGREALNKFSYIKKDGDHFVAAPEIPYNLGLMMKKMKAGDVLPPTVIREGVLIALVEDIKDLPKPSLEKVREDIRTYLVSDRLSQEIQSLRKEAKIELKG